MLFHLAMALVGLVTLICLLRLLPRQAKLALVVVLGDIGRSPRMCNHARSLLRHGWSVNFLGYLETSLPNDLATHPQCHILPVQSALGPLAAYPRWLFPPLALLKFAKLAASLTMQMLKSASAGVPSWVIVQNPPSFPSLPVCRLVCCVLSQRLVIDWHNTGASILAMRFGEESKICRAASTLEGWCGKRASVHLFVTDAMQRDLTSRWSLHGKLQTFYDRPMPSFRHLGHEEKQDFFSYAPHLAPPKGGILAVSSTSWTADEDFDLLLQALSHLEQQRARSLSYLRPLKIIITGKGPMKAEFEAAVAERSARESWSTVTVKTAWLESQDYPKLLGAADFGISLHTSSSGLDLPMKVVDMLGCGLPVICTDFKAMSELVVDGRNGFLVSSVDEMQAAIQRVTSDPTILQSMSRKIETSSYGADQRPWRSWDEEWDECLWPLISSI